MALSTKNLRWPLRMWDLGGLRTPLLLVALLLGGAACALLQPKSPPSVYHTIPSVTYLRSSPGYASPNVATVYRGEQVKILNQLADDWCLVQTVQGQQTGWMQLALLSPVPIPAAIYAVQDNEAPLRDVPQKEGTSRQVLHRGDKVRKLSENQQGWWWVLVEKDESLGWLPGTTTMSAGTPETAAPAPGGKPSGEGAAGPSAPAPPAGPQYFYVATASLDLHSLPLVSSPVVKALKFKDKVEKIAQSGSEWLKVRYPETGAQGWTQVSPLAESPPAAPKVFPPKPKKPLKKPRRLKPAGPGTPPPEEVEPEVM
jgi:uncharacterized protein YgiM (DUF1202 family)